MLDQVVALAVAAALVQQVRVVQVALERRGAGITAGQVAQHQTVVVVVVALQRLVQRARTTQRKL